MTQVKAQSVGWLLGCDQWCVTLTREGHLARVQLPNHYPVGVDIAGGAQAAEAQQLRWGTVEGAQRTRAAVRLPCCQRPGRKAAEKKRQG
jgi:hypothetical protein